MDWATSEAGAIYPNAPRTLNKEIGGEFARVHCQILPAANRNNIHDLRVQSREIRSGNDMRRVARFFFWGGVAAIILGIGACGISIMAGLASLADREAMETAENTGAFGVGVIILGVIAVFIGAFLSAIVKAFSKD